MCHNKWIWATDLMLIAIIRVFVTVHLKKVIQIVLEKNKKTTQENWYNGMEVCNFDFLCLVMCTKQR